MRSIYRYIQALSLDVALGATVMSAFIAHFMNVEIGFSIYASLFTSVWLIYTIDHLIDARRINGNAESFRHRFHQKNFTKLTILWIVVFLFGTVFSILFLPEETIKVGLVAVALVIVHLVLVYLLGTRVSIFIQKELGVAFTYCLGVAVGPVSMSDGVHGFGYFFLGQIFVLALINLLEFSWFDKKLDSRQGHTSVVRGLGEKVVLELVFFLFTLFILSMVVAFLFFPHYGKYEILIAIMGAVLFLVFVFQNYFAKNDRYRMVGDMVFLLPVLMLFEF